MVHNQALQFWVQTMLCFNRIMVQDMQECLKLQPFQLLQWLAQSLDLNPMEHFWALLKQRLNEFFTPPRGIEEVWERVCIVSSNFNEEDCTALYESMLRRIVVVLVAKGY